MERGGQWGNEIGLNSSPSGPRIAVILLRNLGRIEGRTKQLIEDAEEKRFLA